MKQSFGFTEKGEEAVLYIMKNSNNMEASVTNYGAALVKLLVPDKDRQLQDVVLGYDDVKGYENGDKFFGAAVGRIANRIGGASFVLNGREYTLEQNDNNNNLHSGNDFYNTRLWTVEEADEQHVVFSLHSAHMDQGYPGDVNIKVTYTLTEENELKIYYYALPEQDTIINMTNHSYFNLSGEASGDVLNQEVWINADAYTRADKFSIPTGEITPVEGTPMDFRISKPVGRDIEKEYEALVFGTGYDHNWVLNGNGYRKAASMYSSGTGILMEVYTDLPGMQFYTGNFLKGEPGKGGVPYCIRQGACFETQYFPDAVHKDNFDSPVVIAGEVYETVTAYKFKIQKDS